MSRVTGMEVSKPKRYAAEAVGVDTVIVGDQIESLAEPSTLSRSLKRMDNGLNQLETIHQKLKSIDKELVGEDPEKENNQEDPSMINTGRLGLLEENLERVSRYLTMIESVTDKIYNNIS